MAKGRKLTTSRSERFLGILSYNQGQGTASGESELVEDEVWSIVDDSVHDREWSSRAAPENTGYRSRLPPPRSEHLQVGDLSVAFADSGNTSSPRIVHQFRTQDSVAESTVARQIARSAPVNVPDWSKIYRVNSVESLHETGDELNDSDSEFVPPHEYLAREYGRSRKMAANSVFEGVGRTLKGRDLSRVRDAVWSQTGFYG